MANQDKIKFSIRVDSNLVQLLDESMELGNANSRTELIEDAIRFYLSFLTSTKIEDYLLQSLSSVITSAVRDSENRMARMDFKLAVALYELTQILAYTNGGIDEDTMRRLHIRSIEEVKRINGALRYEDAVKYQSGG